MDAVRTTSRKPVVAIVGRPNVGKSTLFNRLAGRRIAVVEETPGITRDRLYAPCEWQGYPFDLIDTGGFSTGSEVMTEDVRRQVEFAIDEADAILFVVDGKEGLSPLDQEVAELLRKTGKRLLLVVNKVDSKRRAEEAVEFYQLAAGDPIMISAVHGQDVDLMLDQLIEIIPKYEPSEEVSEDVVRAAIVGRPNVGKSRLLNALLQEERAIVSEVPGTTRDSIDTPFEWGGRQFVLIDTAGIRRKRKVKGFEYYSVIRAFGAIERCDVALCLLDPNEGVTDQDKRIVGYAHEEGRASILVVNKWDLVKDRARADAEQDGRRVTARQIKTLMADFTAEVRRELVFAEYAPVVFVSALRAEGLSELMETVVDVAEQHSKRVPTAMLNQVTQEATTARSLSFRGRVLKVYYATQPQVRPPTFVLFVNDPDYVHFSHRRYLENVLREKFSFEGSPLRMTFREAKGKERSER